MNDELKLKNNLKAARSALHRKILVQVQFPQL